MAIRALIPFIFLLITGCGAYTLDRAQDDLRADFATGDLDRAASHLERMEKREVYKSKDAVLLHLERGMVHHFNREFEASNEQFSLAETAIEENFTRSISRGVSSMIVSDNRLAYRGEDYEDVYINVFKALNYIHMEQYESALVEARRISHKLENVELRNRGLAEVFAKADSSGHGEWEAGRRVVENSALGHYLSAVLYAKTGRPDNARIEYERLRKAFLDQQEAFSFSPPPEESMRSIITPNEYNVLVTGFSGQSPYKLQHDVRLFVGRYSTYLKFSLPSLHLHASPVARMEVVVGDSVAVPTYVIEEMDRVAKDVYKVSEPIVYARAFTRSALKAVGTRAATKAAHKESEALGVLTWLAGVVGQEITEKADLRGWQTMPGKVHVQVLKLPPGLHDVQINYLNSQNRVLYSERQTIEVFPGNDLALIESLYWN
ncbi:MAG: hypothetical protein ACNA78_00375 [Balneolaceae bacterium]